MKLNRFRIVVVYESLNAGLRAKEVADRLSTQLKPQFLTESNVWKLELLNHPLLREEAAHEAADADMIILSCNGNEEPPDTLKTWIGDAMTNRSRSGGSLVALLETEQTQNPPAERTPLTLFLHQMAKLGGLDFFCKTGDWSHQEFDYSMASSAARAGESPRASEISNTGPMLGRWSYLS